MAAVEGDEVPEVANGMCVVTGPFVIVPKVNSPSDSLLLAVSCPYVCSGMTGVKLNSLLLVVSCPFVVAFSG